jgi:hypothetical protein
VGDLTDDASQGPEAIRIQIEQSGQLLVVLVGAASRDWVESELASPLSRQDPQPERATQPPAANGAPPAPGPAGVAAPSPSRGYLAASQRWQP